MCYFPFIKCSISAIIPQALLTARLCRPHGSLMARSCKMPYSCHQQSQITFKTKQEEAQLHPRPTPGKDSPSEDAVVRVSPACHCHHLYSPTCLSPQSVVEICFLVSGSESVRFLCSLKSQKMVHHKAWEKKAPLTVVNMMRILMAKVQEIVSATPTKSPVGRVMAEHRGVWC
jgi:hypothetical protein